MSELIDPAGLGTTPGLPDDCFEHDGLITKRQQRASAFAFLRPGPGQLPRVIELARALPQVSECHRITGEDCFLLKVHARDVGAFEETLDRFLLHGQTTTSIIQSTAVPPRTPGLT